MNVFKHFIHMLQLFNGDILPVKISLFPCKAVVNSFKHNYRARHCVQSYDASAAAIIRHLL